MAKPKKPEKVKVRLGEAELQVSLMQAVALGHLQAVELAGKALNEHFIKYITKIPRKTGPQMLDFVVTKDFEIPVEYKPHCKTHSPLMLALELGRADIAEKLIALEASVAFKNKDGLTALHIACNKGMAGIVRGLLLALRKQTRFCQKKGAQKSSDCEEVINSKERPQGWTPLMYAVKGGHVETVRELMEYKSLKYDILNQKEQNACHVAAREGQLECLQLLHTKSGDRPFLAKDKKDWNLLHQVCCHGDVKMLKWMLETIPKLNTKESLNQESWVTPNKADASTPELRYTPLLVACLYKKTEIVTFLTEKVSHLVDFTACCHRDAGRGTSALHLAAVHDAVDMAKQLIRAGCPLDGQDVGGNTILHVAKRWSSGAFSRFMAAECEKKHIDLAKVRNLDKKMPSEVEEENVIPLEIKKRGPEAVQIYIHALNEGKEKIPYCGLLILGKQKVGKTSLYRQLVKKPFKIDLVSTRGIDNNIVDTVEKRPLGVVKGKWQEKDREPDRNERFIDGLSNELMGALPQKPAPEAAEDVEVMGVGVLLAKIQDIVARVVKEKEEKALRVVSQPVLPTTTAFQPSAPATPPAKKQPTTPKIPRVKTATARPKAPKVAHKAALPTTRPVAAPRKATERPPPREKVQPDPTPPQDSDDPNDPRMPVEEDHLIPRLEPWEGVKINDMVRSGVQDKKEPSLLLNTLDFAGQEVYRPMHYCFISRRALYVIVFKIPDMLEFIEREPDNNVIIEEVRYWIHSIHARIYPPEELVEKEDKKMNRVFLVGTHRGDKSTEDLLKIDAVMKESLIMCETDHCVNHIHRRPTCDENLKFFFPVENSIDFQVSEENYLKESGTKFFQEEVETKCEGLAFLNEDHPLKWLKFEESLEQRDIARSCSPVMSLEEVKGFARRAGIVEEVFQDLALKFLHDTGKIIYLDCLPRLFLTKAEHEQLAGHIVLRPQWLMSIMQVVMELTTDKEEENLSQDQVKGVEKNGIADFELLEVCWKKFVPESLSDIKIRHLCLILQAYCLIYPYPNQSITIDGSSGTPQKYIIPCKLPDRFKGNERHVKNRATFYFDFNLFLPVEIYHKLICLASSKANPPSGSCNQYSRKKCSFHGLLDTKWVMEIEQEKHRLKITVIVRKGDVGLKPVEYITYIHGFLCDICKESGLKGLEYHGGPMEQCGYCGNDNIMFRCVEFSNGEEKVNTTVSCTSCLTKYDVKLLCSTDSDQGASLLEMKNQKEVLEMVRDVAASWDDLCIALGLGSCVGSIEADERGCYKRLKKVVAEWLSGNGGERSWKFLCEAIRGPLVKETAIAEKIELKYCRNK